MSCTWDKEVVQGTDRHYRLTFTSPDEVDPETNPEGRVDLTGATVYYRWKRYQNDPNPAEIAKSSGDPAEILILTQSGDTLGQADVFLVPSDTDTLTSGINHYWDAWVELSDGTRHAAIPPSKAYLIDAVTDLVSPSPSPSGGPGDGDDTTIMERTFSIAHQQADTVEVSLGRVPFGYSLVGITAEIGFAVTVGTITANLKLNAAPVLTAALDSVTNPVFDKDQETTGTHGADENDAITLEIVTADYENAGGLGSTLEINVVFARTHPITTEANAQRGEPTGFTNRVDSDISKVDGTRTFTIAPTGAQFSVWVEGVQYVKTAAENVVWPDTEGLHWFYYDDTGALSTKTTTPDFKTEAVVAVLYWDATNSVVLNDLGDERHGIGMAGATHDYLHWTRGATFGDGLSPGNLVVDGNGSSDTHAQFSIAEGAIWDEDLYHQVLDSVQDITPILNAPVLYRSGATAWRRKTPDTFPFVYAGQEGAPGTKLPYNSNGGSWGWTECGNNNFVLIHAFVTHDLIWPVTVIHGQAEYTTIPAAREGATTELNNLYVAGLPLPEYMPLATFILQTSDSYSNTPLARLRSTAEGDFVDWRFTRFIPGVGVGAEDSGALSVTAVKTASYDAQFNEIVRCDSTGGAFPVNLPAITAGSAGLQLLVKSAVGSPGAGINDITVTPDGTDTIDGEATFVIDAARTGLLLYSDGEGTWMIF
jgi:hypothetical protein